MAATTPTINQLRELVQRASRENPHLTTRLEKAAFLVLLRPLLSMGDDHYPVGAEDGLRNYEVRNGHCECSDYLRHGAGHHCKHRLALALSLELGYDQTGGEESTESPSGIAGVPNPTVRDELDSDTTVANN